MIQTEDGQPASERHPVCNSLPWIAYTLTVAAGQIQPGHIVVAAGTAECLDGNFGDLLATSFLARSARVLIIDAGVRDVKVLKEMGFPVLSKAIDAKGIIKTTLDSVKVPMICAGALLNPGDAIISDNDGMVVPASDTVHGVQAAQKRDMLAAGVPELEMYDMRGALEAAGLTYIG